MSLKSNPEKQSRVSKNVFLRSKPSNPNVKKKLHKRQKSELVYLAKACSRMAQHWVMLSYENPTLGKMVSRNDVKQKEGDRYFDIGNGLWLNKRGNVVDIERYPLRSGYYLDDKSFASEVRERKLQMISSLQRDLKADLDSLLDLLQTLLESKYVALVLVYRILLKLLDTLNLNYSLSYDYKILETSIEEIKTLTIEHLQALSTKQKERSENANTWTKKIIDFGKKVISDEDTENHLKLIYEMDKDAQIQSILNLEEPLHVDIAMRETSTHFKIGDVTIARSDLLTQLSDDASFFLSTEDESLNATLDLFPMVTILTKSQNALLTSLFMYLWGESLTQDASRLLTKRFSVQIAHQMEQQNPGYNHVMFVKDVLCGSIGLELIDKGPVRDVFLLILRLLTRLLMLDPLRQIKDKQGEGTQLLLEQIYVEFMQEKLGATSKPSGFDMQVCEILVSRFLPPDKWTDETSHVCSDARLKVLYETDVIDPVLVDSQPFRFHLYKWNSKKLRSLRSNVWRYHSEDGPLPDLNDKSYFVSLCAQEVIGMQDPVYRMAVKRSPNSKYLFIDLSFLPRAVVDTLYRVNQDLCNRNPRDCTYLKLSPVSEIKYN